MEVDGRADPPACSLPPAGGAERRERWLGLIDRARLDKAVTEAGVRLRFRALPGVQTELLELAALERECCSFAAWSVSRDRANLILEVSAESHAAGIVRALFEQQPPRSQTPSRAG